MRILNVGCGQQIYGTDFIDLYPQRPEVVKCDFQVEAFPFEDNLFDEVYADNIFEHLLDPHRVLKEMARVLKPGGRLVVITDNASFWAYHLGARTHYGGYEERQKNDQDRHYALYTSWHLYNHLKALNLKEIKTEYMLIPSKHSNRLLVKMFSYLLSLFLPNIAYPQIKVTAIK